MRFAMVITSMLVASTAMANDLDAAGRARLAEMMAFVRDGPDQCGETVPQEWPLEVLALYMAADKKAPLEDEVTAKQSELAALKSKIGIARWCALYRIEMKEADMIANPPR